MFILFHKMAKTMKVNCSSDGTVQNMLDSIILKDKQERFAAATSTSETLTKLNISIDAFPPKCQQHLQQIANTQAATKIDQLDSIALSLHQTKLISEQLTDEYEILKLKQKDEELQAKIDRNNRFLEDLKKELECSKSSLMLRSPNPETVQEAIRQLKQKVASYEESCEKAKAKYSKLPVSDAIRPKSIVSLAHTLSQLREEAASLQARAEDVRLARQARDTLTRLMR